MGNPGGLAATSLALSLGVAAIALMLGLRLWWERRTRDHAPDADDRRFFRLQDLRRGAGVALMAGLAAGIYSGSRIPTFVGAEPDRHPNRLFLVVWLGVMAAVVLLLALAMIDWTATRRYARRHRLAIDRERAEILRRTFRERPHDADGQANGPPSPSQ